ncbi:SDR family oxidoreductase [Hymenobacter terrenus]|uniref:SDR family oxidoreductase n=1 Tax=Hymenobacter terrenus TaxID=1629124 RepID=UPI000619B706|nr:SDR family oxidoreductase [Hymenobacter terrenus]
MSSLKHKNVLVVGGSEGIGLAVAQAAQAAGAQVYVASRSEHKLTKASAVLGSSALTFPVDFTDESSVQRLFQHLPAVDHLIITAIAKTEARRVADLSVAEAQMWFAAKFWGAYTVVRHALPKLATDGSITLFSGNFSVRPSQGWSVLASANGAIESFGRSLAVELAPVRVNVIRPGLVQTPAYSEMPAEARREMFQQYESVVPARKAGLPEEIAQAVVFAITNPYMTGSVLTLDGGARLV